MSVASRPCASATARSGSLRAAQTGSARNQPPTAAARPSFDRLPPAAAYDKAQFPSLEDQDAAKAAIARDPVDAVNDADFLLGLLQPWAAAIVDAEMARAAEPALPFEADAERT